MPVVSCRSRIFECANISMNFGGLQVLSGVNIALAQGERRAILGPNGAGKTTLFNVICGELVPSQGSVLIRDKDVTKKPSFTRVHYGFARTYQVTNLFFDMTVLENIFVALHGCQSNKLMHWKPVLQSGDLYDRAIALLEQFAVASLRYEVVRNISYGDQRLLEIILALSSRPSILALDEPTSGLSVAETKQLVEVLNSLDSSLTILLIEHDMGEAFDVAQTVTVLHRGKVIADGTKGEIAHSSLVRDVYMGVM